MRKMATDECLLKRIAAPCATAMLCHRRNGPISGRHSRVHVSRSWAVTASSARFSGRIRSRRRFDRPVYTPQRLCTPCALFVRSQVFPPSRKWTATQPEKSLCHRALRESQLTKKTAAFSRGSNSVARGLLWPDFRSRRGQYLGTIVGTIVLAQVSTSFILKVLAAVRWPRG